MESTKKLLITISICLLLIVISSFYLVKLTSSNNTNQKESINNNDISQEKDIDNTIDEPINNSYITDETINDLKDNLGKGTNGGVNKVDQSTNENGEKQYIFHYEDGDIKTITIVNDDSKSNIEEINPDDDTNLDEGNNDPQQQEEPDSSKISQEQAPPEQEIIEESPGTVFERYQNMTSREKYAFYKSFDSQQAYLEWYKAAQAEYLALHPTIEIGTNQKAVVE